MISIQHSFYLVIVLSFPPLASVCSCVFEMLDGVSETSLVSVKQESGVDAADDAKVAIGKLLDDFRTAAEEADGGKYFGCLHPDSIVLGTDEKERFALPEFKATFEPYFKKGIGWKRVVLERHIYVGPNNLVGWFEEKSRREEAIMRTTGVVRLTDNGWKITMYHTSMPIPNEIFLDVAELVKKAKNATSDKNDN